MTCYSSRVSSLDDSPLFIKDSQTFTQSFKLHIDRHLIPFIRDEIETIQRTTNVIINASPEGEVGFIGSEKEIQDAVFKFNLFYNHRKKNVRTLAIPIEKRLHRFLIDYDGHKNGSQFYLKTGCTLHIPDLDEVSEIVHVRGIDHLLSNALQLVLEKANSTQYKDIPLATYVAPGTPMDLLKRYLESTPTLKQIRASVACMIELDNDVFLVQGSSLSLVNEAVGLVIHLLVSLNHLWFGVAQIPLDLGGLINGQDGGILQARKKVDPRLVDLVFSDPPFIVIERLTTPLSLMASHEWTLSNLECHEYALKQCNLWIQEALQHKEAITITIHVDPKHHSRLIGIGGTALKELISNVPVNVRFPMQGDADKSAVIIRGHKSDVQLVADKIIKAAHHGFSKVALYESSSSSPPSSSTSLYSFSKDVNHRKPLSFQNGTKEPSLYHSNEPNQESSSYHSNETIQEPSVVLHHSNEATTPYHFSTPTLPSSTSNRFQSLARIDAKLPPLELSPQSSYTSPRVTSQNHTPPPRTHIFDAEKLTFAPGVAQSIMVSITSCVLKIQHRTGCKDDSLFQFELFDQDSILIRTPRPLMSVSKQVVLERSRQLSGIHLVEFEVFEKLLPSTQSALLEQARNSHLTQQEMREIYIKRLIGKNGKLVKTLVEKHSVRINFTKRSQLDTVEITGRPKDIHVAYRHILDRLETDINQVSSIVLRLPLTCIPLILGKGGSRIYSLSKKHHVRMSVRREGSESCCTIEGSVQQCEVVKRVILDLVDSHSVTREIRVPANLHKHVLGPGGIRVAAIVSEFGNSDTVQIHFSKNHDIDPDLVQITANPNVIDEIEARLNDIVLNIRNQGPEETISTMFDVPKSDVSKIIGRQGESIKELMDKFKVSIWIDNDGPEEAVVKITALKEQHENMKLAKLAILDKIETLMKLSVPCMILETIREGPPSSLLPSLLDLMKHLKHKYHVTFDLHGVFDGEPDASITIKGSQYNIEIAVNQFGSAFELWERQTMTLYMTIDGYYRTAVIGRGGCQLDRIRREASVDIVVSPAKPGELFTVTLRATDECFLTKAREMIELIVNEHEKSSDDAFKKPISVYKTSSMLDDLSLCDYPPLTIDSKQSTAVNSPDLETKSFEGSENGDVLIENTEKEKPARKKSFLENYCQSKPLASWADDFDE